MRKVRIYGLIGFPVKHSLSKIMHNSAFSFLNINAEYRLFEIRPKDLEDFLINPDKKVSDIDGKTIYTKDISGFNVTIPHKIRVREILNKHSLVKFKDLKNKKEIDIVGAVNTVYRIDDKFSYYNTDIYGFSFSLKEDLKFNITNETEVFLLGCGGASRAVMYSLCYRKILPKKIYIFDVDKTAFLNFKTHLKSIKEDRIFSRIEFIEKYDIQRILKKCSLLINASPVGMKDDKGLPFKKDFLHNRLKIFDLVYNRETKLIKLAKSLNLKYINGANMLVYQAAKAFEIWTNKRAPIDIMKNALEDAIN